MMAVSRLLKSWAMPPARSPRLSSFWDWRMASSAVFCPDRSRMLPNIISWPWWHRYVPVTSTGWMVPSLPTSQVSREALPSAFTLAQLEAHRSGVASGSMSRTSMASSSSRVYPSFRQAAWFT